MKKIKITLLSLLVILLSLGTLLALPANAQDAASILPQPDLYKAIVKIKTYDLDDEGNIEPYSEGSGAIINQNGLVLTNAHVVVDRDPFDDSIIPLAYHICVPTTINNAPDCSFMGQLAAYNEDLDVALLRIIPIPLLTKKESFNFIALKDQSENLATGQDTIVLGFPAIGGDTMTISKGIISGLPTNGGINWIKTDALISYGSSGGAVVNSAGELIGIPTMANSDYLGTMGYAINIDSLANWINNNKYNKGAENKLNEPALNFIIEGIKLQSANIFESERPSFTIAKPEKWMFYYDKEGQLYIENSADKDGGSVEIEFSKYPMAATLDMAMTEIKASQFKYGELSSYKIMKDENISVNGNSGRKVVISNSGGIETYYLFTSGNYIIIITTDSGKDEKDAQAVQQIINSINIPDKSASFAEIHDYYNENPVFSLSTPADWPLMPLNDKSAPVAISNKNNPNGMAIITIMPLNEEAKKMGNDELLDMFLNTFEASSAGLAAEGVENDLLSSDAHYRLNGELPDVINIEYVQRKIKDKTPLVQSNAYFIKVSDKYLIGISGINFLNSDGQATPFKASMDKMLQGLRVKNAAVETPNSAPLPKESPSQPAAGASTEKKPANNAPGTQKSASIASQKLAIANKKMYSSLKGRIILKIEDNGEAYYVSPSTLTMYYLGRPADAFAVMRSQGVGISNTDLNKIPIAANSLIETGLDSDSDGHTNYTELMNGYNPNGSGKLIIDMNFANKQKGKILIQVEQNGEAWYVNPVDGKRYFLGRPIDAFKVMRELGLGISNANFNSLQE